jgi:hypothetical protein
VRGKTQRERRLAPGGQGVLSPIAHEFPTLTERQAWRWLG